MKYVISPVIPKTKEPQEINEAEYKEIINALKLAWDILLIKELFSYVVRNYSQLEITIKKIETEANNNSDDLREKLWNGSFSCENSHIFNLLVMNLLTTIRSYLELFDYQGRNKKKEVFSKENDIREILKNIKKEYHKPNVMAGFFWDLRNYAQHHSRPIKGSPTKGSLINIDPQVKIGFAVDVNKILKQSDKCQEFKNYLTAKSSAYSLEELQGYPKNLNIRPLIKEYIFLIKNIHEETNKKIDSKFQEAKKILIQKVEYYCQDSSPESAFIISRQNEESQELEESFDVQLQLIDNWQETIKKYSDLSSIIN